MQKQILKSFFLIAIFLMLPKNAFAEDPLLYANNLEYLGAFRVPSGNFGTSSFNYASATITFNPINSSLFIVGHNQNPYNVAEIAIPNSVDSTIMSNLPISPVPLLQNFIDITEGNYNFIATGGTDISIGTNGIPGGPGSTHGDIGGLLVYKEKLVGSLFSYYDGGGRTERSHFTSGLMLSDVGDYSGNFQVGPTGGASLRSGFMTLVPDEKQSALGGPVLTGQGGISNVSRTSAGPAAFAFNPDDLGVISPVIDVPLIYYQSPHSTLGNAIPTLGEPVSRYWSLSTRIKGMVLVPNTNTLLFFGYHGLGPYCYGGFTNNPNLIGNYEDECYDPTGVGGKGPHEYPYIYQAWAYDTTDIAAVKIGSYVVTQSDFNSGRFVEGTAPNNTSLPVGSIVNPWNVKPYATWKLPFNFVGADIYGGSAAFDPVSKRLYIASTGGDVSDLSRKPLIHVFHVNLTNSPAITYKIKGQVILLNGSVILRNNGGDELTITADNRSITQEFVFDTAIAPGANYNVTITSQPNDQTCEVHRGYGTIDANADVENILVICNNNADTIAPTAPSGFSVQ